GSDVEPRDRTEPSRPRVRPDPRPALVLYKAGVDPLAEDRLGRLSLPRDGPARRDELVFRAIEDIGAPVVLTLGGGYAQPLEATIEAHVNVWRAARRARDRREEPVLS